MPLVFNGTTIENAIYNGTTLEKIIFNGTEVFSAGFTLNITISSNTTNYSIASAATALGWDGVKKLKGTITINSGVYVYSTSTGTPAFQTGTIPSGSDVTVINNGYIVGKGGTGGTGGASSPYCCFNPTSGGLAFYATSSLKLTNNGVIGGGGGGGGRGGAVWISDDGFTANLAGGGGGGGAGYGSAGGIYGEGWTNNTYAQGGNAGTGNSGGAGGLGTRTFGYVRGGDAGAGGGLGSYGGSGASGNHEGYGHQTISPTSGAAPGAAVVGNGNITWNATGTRNGAIS